MTRSFSRARILLPALVALALVTGCAEPGHPPLVNSGSYDWSDAYRGPNGYPLPGY
jgi:hypothetical protein